MSVYTEGQSLDLAGLNVTGVYNDGSTVSVTSGYTVIWNNAVINTGNTAVTAAAGTQILTVAWRGQTANLTISVNPPDALIDVSSEANWSGALSDIISGGDGSSGAWKGYIIDVNGNFAVSGDTVYSFGSNVQYVHVILTGTGTVSLSSQGNLLRLDNNQTLVIDDAGLTLQGLTNGQNGKSVDNNTALVYLGHANSKLELRNGVISGNTNSSSSGGSGGVLVDGGAFTMSGGEISGNTGAGGGGVRVSGSGGAFTMSGGEISGNTGVSGGGVLVNGGTFTMSGGEISGNNASGSGFGGGGVYVNGGEFTMSGGEISDNSTSGRGGGVFVINNGTFNMSGGTISGNTSSGRGGGVCVYTPTDTFSKSGGGIIYGYDSADPTNPLWNKVYNGDNTYGHAVYFFKDNGYYRDTTLYTGDNITTSTLPSSGIGGNWTKK
jgi:hypothetical protein